MKNLQKLTNVLYNALKEKRTQRVTTHKKTILTLLFIMLLINPVSALKITEIMYNPEGNDNNKEFIEIEGSNNLSGYIIGDLIQNDSLELISFNNQSNFSLIVESSFNYTGINASIYSAGSTIGNSLDNGGDTIFLYFNHTLSDLVEYTSEFANGNGHSLELFNGEWKESNNEGGSPGAHNPKSTNFCNVYIDLETDREIYLQNETINFRNKLSNEDHEYLITYYITDLFNNYIRYPRNTSNTNAKSFTPYIFESEQVFIFHNELSYLDCNNTNTLTRSNKTVIVKGEKIKESYIKISKIEKTFEFGDTIWPNLEVYKGNSSEDILYIYLSKDNEKITKRYKIDLETNYQKYKISVPVNIPFDCNRKLANGTYNLNVEGFDLIEIEDVYIAGKKEVCTDKEENISEQKEEFILELINSPEEVNLNEELKIELNVKTNKKTNFEIYSYVYAGPVSLSGERESNKKQLIIYPGETIIELKNTVTKYSNHSKLKIRYSVDGSEKEITENIIINHEEKAEQFSEPQKSIGEKTNSITTKAIYESSSEKSKKYGVYIFIALMTLAASGFIIKNELKNKNDNRNSRVPGIPHKRNNAENVVKNKRRQRNRNNKSSRRTSKTG